MSLDMSFSAFLSKLDPALYSEVVSEPKEPGRPKSRQGTKGKNLARVNVCADFETTTDALDCRVWGWGLADVEKPLYDDVELGGDIHSFIERISSFNSICYFHNLRFDGAFILDYLLNNGYAHLQGNTEFEDGTFKTLISNMGKFYSITVRWKDGHRTEFRDSLKKLPMSVQRVAKSFNLETSKGEIDYKSYRPIGHVMTDEESDYMRRDVSIMAQAMHEVISSGMKKLTVASDSMAEFKALSGDLLYEKRFPVLSPVMDAEIRRAYRGGFTYADDRFKGKQLKQKGLVLDVNSLYPSVMRNRMIPWGVPIFKRGEVVPTEDRPLTIFSVTFVAKLKPNHIPCIQIKGTNMFIGTEYLREINEPTTMMVSNVDWDLYNDHYDIEVIAYGGGWRFKAQEGMFNDYIDKWSEIKANSKGGLREIAKLHLNSLYGKFASNPNVTGKIPVLGADGIVHLKRGPEETRPPVYTAAGVFITAWARDVTIRAAQNNYSTFAYADTDSLHLLQSEIPSSIDVHPTRLGAWKHEYDFLDSYYIRPKAYLERINDVNEHEDDCSDSCTTRHDYVNRIAGVPLPVSGALGIEDLQEGMILHGKLAPKTVRGGVVLDDVPFKLKLAA
jgi:hypothetical protein